MKQVIVLGGPTGPTGTFQGVTILGGPTAGVASWGTYTGPTGVATGVFERVYSATGPTGRFKSVSIDGYSVATTTDNILAANRNQLATTFVNIPNNFTSMREHYASPEGAISALQTVDAGFYLADTFAITNPAASYTIKRYIEYPAGTFTQVTWSGATTLTITPGQSYKSDAITLSIPAGTKFWERTVNVSGGAKDIPCQELPAASTALVDITDGNDVTDKGNSGTITASSGTTTFGSVAILGTVAKVSARAFVLFGDSITWGFGDITSIGVKGASGWVARGLDHLYPWMKIAKNSIRSDQIRDLGATITTLLGRIGFTDTIVGAGTNDLSQGTAAAAAIITSNAAIYTQWASGKRYYLNTLLPRTTSTDSFATTVNQTEKSDGNWSQLDTYNGLVRAVPASVTGAIEVADVAMTSRNVGVWVAPPVPTTDGTHPNSVWSNILSTAVGPSVNVSAPFYAIYVDHAEDNSAQTTETFSGKAFPIGAPAAGRKVVATLTVRFTGSATINSVTIGGVAATKVSEAITTPGMAVSMWEAVVPTGNTATISAVYSAASTRSGVMVHTVTGSNGVTPSGGAVAQSYDTTTPLTGDVSLTVLTNGTALIVGGYAQGATSSVIATATNFTRNVSAIDIGGQFAWHTAGVDRTAGARAYTITYSTTSSPNIAATVAAAYA